MSSNYNNKVMNELWNEIAPGYYNYGRISPDADVDKIKDLKQANEDMADWIVAKLGINKDSHVLDLACGKGMYTVRIAKTTGCRYTGVELNTTYLENECKVWANKHGVNEQGEFVLGSITDLPPEVKEKEYTHIICLGSMYYVHDKIDLFLENVANCSNMDTKIFIWDFVTNVDWSLCSELNIHLKMKFPIRPKIDVFQRFENSKLELTEYSDFTKYIIPGYKVMERECRKRDPELKKLTYPLLGKAFMNGTVSYVYYILRLQ